MLFEEITARKNEQTLLSESKSKKLMERYGLCESRTALLSGEVAAISQKVPVSSLNESSNIELPVSGEIDLASLILEENPAFRMRRRIEPAEALQCLKDANFNDNAKKLYKNLNAIVLITDENAIKLGSASSLDELPDDAEIILDTLGLSDMVVQVGDQTYRLAPDSPFAEQARVKICYGTGFFIKKNVVATAQHIPIKHSALFIRGWYVNLTGQYVVRKSDLFKMVPNTMVNGSGFGHDEEAVFEDWQFFEVKPVVPSVQQEHFVKTSDSKVRCGADLYCLGHSLNQPVKLSWNGLAFQVAPGWNTFFCKLETFSGNSGSPVFSFETHEVVGILSGQDSQPFQIIGDKIVPHVFLAGQLGARCTHIHRLTQQLNLRQQ